MSNKVHSRSHLSLAKSSSPSISPARNRNRSSARLSSSSNLRANDSLTQEPHKWDLIRDLQTIKKLTEVNTEIGLARAFVRLAIEKKVLGDHLKTLISEADLLM